MSNLSLMTLVLGGVLLALYTPLVAWPRRACEWGIRFPRNRTAGLILVAIDLLWAAWLVSRMPLGFLEKYKPALYILTPVAYVAIVVLVDELLAARAFGGLMLLIPAPLLINARWHESGFRYVVIVFAYVTVIKGMILVLNPYVFRRWVERIGRTEGRARGLGAVGLGLAGVLICLSLTVY